MKMESFNQTSHLEGILCDTIFEIQEIHRANGRSPDFATLPEIHNGIKAEIMDALRTMYRKGLIEFHRTVNGAELFGLKQSRP